MAKLYQKTWKPVFSKKTISLEAAKEFVDRYHVNYNWEMFSSPDLPDFETFLINVKSAAPGPDGLPYEAWKVAGRAGALTLYNASQWLFCGKHLGDGFNHSRSIFIKKR